MILAVIIGLVVFLVGLAIFELGMDILDEADYLFNVVGGFLLLFTASAIALYVLLPRDLGPARMAVFSPANLADRFASIGYGKTASNEAIYTLPLANNESPILE